MAEISTIPYDDRPGFGDDPDLGRALLAAMQSAQAMHRSGVRLVPRPTKLPPLNIDALMRLPPAQAAQVILKRRELEQDNIADEKNQAELLNLSFKEQTARKELDRAGVEFSRQFGDVLVDTAETEAQKSKALQDVNQFAQQASRLQREGAVTWDKQNQVFVPILPTQKATPTPGQSYAHAAGLSLLGPGSLLLGGDKKALAAAQKQEASSFEESVEVRKGLAATLNQQLQRRKEEAETAKKNTEERFKTNTEFMRRMQREGFGIDQSTKSLVHVVTGKRYPIRSGRGTKQGTNAVKSFIYQGEGKPLLPK